MKSYRRTIAHIFRLKNKLKMLSLFSGIGGFECAAKMCGNVETIATVEKDPFASSVLRFKFPGAVHLKESIREMTKDTLAKAGITEIDIVAGDFPCQDFSRNNPDRKQIGPDSDKNLFPEMFRLISELKKANPRNCRWIICENVEGFLDQGLQALQEALTHMGYEYHAFLYPAAAVGYPQKRNRVFVVACDFGGIKYNIHPGEPLGQDILRTFEDTTRRIVAISPTLKTLLPLDTFSANSLICAGNAVVPEQALPIFQAIVEVERKLQRGNLTENGVGETVTINELFTRIFKRILTSHTMPYEKKARLWEEQDPAKWAPHARLKIKGLPVSTKEDLWWPTVVASLGKEFDPDKINEGWAEKYPELLTGKWWLNYKFCLQLQGFPATWTRFSPPPKMNLRKWKVHLSKLKLLSAKMSRKIQ